MTNRVHLWEAPSGKLLVTLGEEREEPLFVSDATFSPDGTQLLVVSRESTQLWETSSGKLLSTLEDSYSFDSLTKVAFSSDGTTIILGLFEGTAGLWEAASGKRLTKLEGHSSSISHVAFSPGNRLAITCDLHGNVRFWSASGSEAGRLVGLYTAIYEIVAIYWYDAHHLILADRGGPHGYPHFYQLKLEGLQ